MSAQRRVREASDEAPLMTSNIAWGGEEEEIVPPPHSKLAYGILLLQGFGLLIPWNVILNTYVRARACTRACACARASVRACSRRF
ncbi:hypothetical protein EON66_03405 [archaeon]|nr:MAG: hypothetical protein EON66_03405 [archaeon]